MTTVPPAGETVCSPEFSGWPGIAKEHRERRYPFDRLRDEWRTEMVRLARRYTESLGLASPEIPPGAPIILSGHQPYFYHPGVLYKYRLLARAAEEGMAAININVDTDLSEGCPAKVPMSEGGIYRIRTLHLAPHGLTRFFADVAIGRGAWVEFAEEAGRCLRSLPGLMYGPAIPFLHGCLADGIPDNAVSAMVVLRRGYAAEWPGNVLEVRLSELCGTAGYFEFAYGLLERGEEFARVFNAALDRYRAEHKLRYPANPFPNLVSGPAGSETLFWTVTGEKRATLSVRRGKEGVELISAGATVKGGAELRALAETTGMRLWPKAVALSLMHRLYLADFFIHGIGGAKYDQITDEVIRGFHGLEPPAFAAASTTLAMEGLADPTPRLMELKQNLRESGFHPERFLAIPPVALVDAKRRLLADIHREGADKKALGKELARVNAELNLLLAPLKVAMEEGIRQAETEQNRYEALANRELSYFLFPASAMPS